MDVEKIAKFLGWAFLILLCLFSYFIGAQSQNAWAGVLVFLGILLAWIGTGIYAFRETLAGYLLFALLSLGALGLAIRLFRSAGGWWWTGVWLMVALAHYVTAVDAWQEEDNHMRVALTLGILSTAAAFTTPWLFPPLLQGEAASISSGFWMWPLLVLAVVALGIAWYQGYKKSAEKRFIWWSLIGVGLLAGATWLSKMAGGWWWSLPWACAALALGHAAIDLRRYSFGRGAGNLGIVLALLCLIFAAGGPVLLPKYLEGGAPGVAQVDSSVSPLPSVTPTSTISPVTPTATPVSEEVAPTTSSQEHIQVRAQEGWPALGTFLLSALRSVWGIFHFLTLFALGYLWLRRWWGGAVAIFLVLLTVWLAGAVDSSVDEIITRIFSSSPATWMEEMLQFSAERYGSMAWGIFLTAFLMSVATVPAVRSMSKFNRVWRLHTGSTLTQSAAERMSWTLRAMGIKPLDSIFTSLILLVIPMGLWIALWVALRRIAVLGNLPVGFAYIPDLTVPHWKPEWGLNYYSLGLVLWLVMLVHQRLQRRFDPLPTAYEGCSKGWALFIGAVVTVSFVPAGVTLFSIAAIVSQILLFPTRVVGMPKPRIETPTPSTTTPVEPGPPEPIKTFPPSMVGSSVWTSPAPIAAMLDGGEGLWFLREDGDLVFYSNSPQKFALPITQGQSLFALKDGQLLVIGNGKDVLWVNGQSGEIVKQANLSSPSHIAVLNPYQTMLAWVSIADQSVKVLALEAAREFALLSGPELAPALTFSSDGRYVAVGGANGEIHLVDFATRRVVNRLALPESSPSRGQAVRTLYARKEGGWLSVYADRRVVLWSADHRIEKEMRPNRRILALDFHAETARLALGLSNGLLQVFDANLSKCFDRAVQEKEISHVCFSRDGRRVFTIGDKTEVRRVDL